LVGSILWLARHAKFLILFGTLRPHKDFQNTPLFCPLEGPRTKPEVVKDRTILYALRTMKCPLGEKAHNNRSFDNLALKGMPKIEIASSGEKVYLTMSICQHLSKGSMRKLTYALKGSPSSGEVSLKVDGLGSHLSLQILVDSSFPSYHQ